MYICEKNAKFHEKILLDSGVVNVQTLMTKYLFPIQWPVWWLLYFSAGQCSCPQGVWDHAAVNLWNTKLHRSNSMAWPEPGRLPDLGEAAEVCVSQPDSWRWPAAVHAWSKSGNISTRCSSMKQSGSGVHIFELAFEHTEDILNTDFSCVWYCTLTVIRLCGCL